MIPLDKDGETISHNDIVGFSGRVINDDGFGNITIESNIDPRVRFTTKAEYLEILVPVLKAEPKSLDITTGALIQDVVEKPKELSAIEQMKAKLNGNK